MLVVINIDGKISKETKLGVEKLETELDQNWWL